MNIRPDQLVQVEIIVSNLSRAITFYRNVFGWEPVPAYIHDYVVIAVPDNCAFGVSLVASQSPRSLGSGGIILYFKSEAPDEIIRAASENGGKELASRHLPGYGDIRQFADPDGQVFGLFS